jgi:hypothetical protein
MEDKVDQLYAQAKALDEENQRLKAQVNLMSRLMEETARALCRGIDPDRLTADYFTVQADGQMAKRLLDAIGKTPRMYQAWLEKQQ